MTLSGLDVVKAGGRAGYTYLTEGRVADTFVLKAPITVGTVKSSLSYVQGVGQMRLLAVCAIAALLPVLLCFCLWECCFWRKEKDDAAANAVYQSGAGRTADCFGCVSGTVSVSVVRDIFLYPAARSRMDTHTDRMDYRRVPSTRKQGNEQIKGKRIRSGPDTAGGAKSSPAEKVEKETQPEKDSSTKRRIQQETKHSSGNIVRFPMTLRNRHTG